MNDFKCCVILSLYIFVVVCALGVSYSTQYAIRSDYTHTMSNMICNYVLFVWFKDQNV